MEEQKLVGLYFRTFSTLGKIKPENFEIHCQGIVVGNPEPGWYLAQLFEWMYGSELNIQLVTLEDMADWRFFVDKSAFDADYKRLK